MKSLYMLRHAKSSWATNEDDHKRPLKKRGKEDALLVTKHLKNILPAPQKIISSDATRAKTTAEYFKIAWNVQDENFEINHDLYDFGGQKVMEIIKNLEDEYDCIMIVGHNYAFTSIVNMIGDTTINNLPTCGFVEIQFDIESWKNATFGKTSTIVFPKDLKPANS